MRQDMKWETGQGLAASIILWPLFNSVFFHNWLYVIWDQGLCLSKFVVLGHVLYYWIKYEQIEYWMNECGKKPITGVGSLYRYINQELDTFCLSQKIFFKVDSTISKSQLWWVSTC